MSTTTHTDQHRQQQHDHLQQLRESVADQVPYVEDLELKQAMREWLASSYSLPAGSVEGHVQHRIAELESEYRMHDNEHVHSSTEAFPDACQGCPSYGGGCPIVSHPTPQRELERLADECEDSETYTLRVRRLARDYDCHRIPEFVAEFESEYAEQIERGHELLAKTDVEIFESATDEPTPRVDVDLEGGEQ